ncbi:solute carrier family 22 member 15-like [Actinia tenebrosa]|uniref:Solute carrier family 22 member 15-like n=1 Tax=Actinia tenebrosa TaxID=6105 RepID=A0A6P8J0G9_ACTTE|nr:solute carrier family 22 member 15-like [Actinia tenebrosa]
MDFDTALKEVGEFGSFQKKIFFITNILAFTVNSQMLIMVFTAAKPEWSCPNSATQCNTDGSICSNAHFTTNFTSISSEFGLICDESYKAEVVQSVYMLGTLIAAPLTGNLGDTYGRKKLWIVTYTGTCIFAFISAFSTSYHMYLVCRFFVGFFVGGCGLIIFVLTTESVGIAYRGFVGIVQQTFFTLFLVVLGGLAYLIPDWRQLTLITLLPAIIQVFFFKSTPESPRWLVSKGRNREAEEVLSEAARVNKGHKMNLVLRSKIQEKKEDSSKGIISIFMHRTTCLITLNLCLSFFVNSLVYYGLSLNVKNLGGSLHVNFILSALVEFPSYVISFFLMTWLGRRKTIFIFMMGASISCFACMRLLESPSSTQYLISSVAMLGKFFISSSFSIIYVYGSELLPTVVRNSGLGVASVANRIGGILCPGVVALGEHSKSMPMLVFAACAFVSGVVGLKLPETKGRALPETFEDVDNSSKLYAKS